MVTVERAVFSVFPAGRGIALGPVRAHTLGFVSEGTAVYAFPNDHREEVVTRGSFIWLPLGTHRSMQVTGGPVLLHSLRFRIDGAIALELPRNPDVVEALNPGYFDTLYKAIERQWVQRFAYGDMETAGLALQILGGFLRANHDATFPPHLRYRVHAVLSYISENYTDRRLTLGHLAAVAGWSGRHLISAFRKVTGETPMAYVRRLRINLSLDLLALGSLTVTEVAQQVGFEDPAYFSRVFSRHMGAPPSAYLGVSSPGAGADTNPVTREASR